MICMDGLWGLNWIRLIDMAFKLMVEMRCKYMFLSQGRFHMIIRIDTLRAIMHALNSISSNIDI
jgi:hypothetical protein